MGKPTNCAKSRFSRGFLVNLVTARQSTSSRDALPPPSLSAGPRFPGAPSSRQRGGGGGQLRGWRLPRWPRPSRAAARGWLAPPIVKGEAERAGSGVGAVRSAPRNGGEAKASAAPGLEKSSMSGSPRRQGELKSGRRSPSSQ